MKLDVARVLGDAGTMAKRDLQMLSGVAGPFLFLPQILQAVFVAPPPPLPASAGDPAALQAWLDAMTLWSKQNDLLVLGLAVVSVFGTLTLFTLYTDRARPDVLGGLRQALHLLPRYLLLALLVTFPVNLGVLLLLIPGLYLKGRLMTASPAFVAERPLGAFAAWRRSFALTRGHGLVLMALACVPVLGGDILALPFTAVGNALDGAPMANPAAAAMIDVCVAAAHTVATVAAILIEVSLYRRLNSGI